MPNREDSLLPAQCTQETLPFHPLSGRFVRGRFDDGVIASDGGGLLLREAEQRTMIIAQLAACFMDDRKPDRIEHRVRELVRQRV